MKQKLMPILLIVIVFFTIVGCGNNKTNGENVENKLIEINNQIIEYFSSDNVLLKDNIAFNYVDAANNVVVVGLKDNSKEQQDKFRKYVVDSEYITFIQGEDFYDQNKE